VIVLTKADLADPGVRDQLAQLYRSLGFDVHVGCAKDPAFVEELRATIGGRVAALVGQSGVGKSTLTRRLTGVDRAVGAVSEQIGGRHTTSDPRQIPLIGGGWVVDTAGVRSLFLPPLDIEDVGDAYPEVREGRANCRFRDCRHLDDAGCAVNPLFSPTRRESYRILVAGP
jgi:ribosome biogenesis GTPase